MPQYRFEDSEPWKIKYLKSVTPWSEGAKLDYGELSKIKDILTGHGYRRHYSTKTFGEMVIFEGISETDMPNIKQAVEKKLGYPITITEVSRS